ncbi:hypothetical protein [Streptomyces cinereoruber]|uniref:hypothetical protein n=1 Tax=Streptomyces cinereoruber TaxID=67260 RepID=UPI003631564E
MIRTAVTCDRDGCLAQLLERDDMPEGVEFEDVVEAAGWTSRPAALVLPGRPDAVDVVGHTCPACLIQRGPVLELGECPRCSGRTSDRADGALCHYCWAVTPHTPDEADEADEERCPAAHPEDPTPCDGPPVVTVLDSSNGGADGCEHHGARLLASLDGGRVYGLPEAPEGAAIRVFKAADQTRPFAWAPEGTPRTGPDQLSRAEVRRADEDAAVWDGRGIRNTGAGPVIDGDDWT